MDEIVSVTNHYIVDPYLLGVETKDDSQYTVFRQFMVMWGLLYSGSLVIYFVLATTTYRMYFKSDTEKNFVAWQYDRQQVINEIFTSVWSLAIMAGMTAPFEIAVMYGYGRVYHNISDYGWGYLLISPLLFLLFTDSMIYWIHRGLHYGWLYKIHKLHHKYKNTTPFSAFSFHPVDGWSQGLPYHIFVFCFPMHNYLYAFTLFVVGLWTINIHDRVTVNLWGVNGAAHHTIHHTKFNYNYGQYFIFWDYICGTYLDPLTISPYKEHTNMILYNVPVVEGKGPNGIYGLSSGTETKVASKNKKL